MAKKRNVALDLLRIFSCYCIIMLHVSGHIDNGSIFWRNVQAVVRPTLWCFMMLSGYFLLSRPIKNWTDFYIKHFIHLLVPLFIYTFTYQIYNGGYEAISAKTVIAGASIGHLWYVYSLIELYLITPLLQKMLENMSDKQIIFQLILIFTCSRVLSVLKSVGIVIGIDGGYIGGTMSFFYILGYALYRMDITKYAKIIIPLGIANLFYCTYGFANPILASGFANLSLGMLIGVLFYFVLFQLLFKSITSEKVQKISSFISARTYGIYLIHMLIFQIFTAREIMPMGDDMLKNAWVLPIKCLAIFVICLVIACVLDLVICEPIQKLLGYVYKKIREGLTRITVNKGQA